MLNEQELDAYVPAGSSVDGQHIKINEVNIFNYQYAKKLREQVVQCEELCQEYVKLIELVIAPHILQFVDDDNILIYQYPPSIRIYPSIDATRVLGRTHSDNEYGHQDGEVNFWLPITAAFDNNTLWAESKTNLQDFHPFNLEYGQI